MHWERGHKSLKVSRSLMLLAGLMLVGSIAVRDIYTHSYGEFGHTRLNPAADTLAGCWCHRPSSQAKEGPSDSTEVYVFTSAHSIHADSTYIFTAIVRNTFILQQTSDPEAGIDIAVRHGRIDSVQDDLTHYQQYDSSDVRVINKTRDLIHRHFRLISYSGTAAWQFKYTAPATWATDTIYAVGNASFKQDDGSSNGAYWNFAPNYPIDVIGANSVRRDQGTSEALLISPNPVNHSANIQISLNRPGTLELQLYDLRGILLKRLGVGSFEAGTAFTTIGCSDLSSGVYLLHAIEDNVRIATERLVVAH